MNISIIIPNYNGKKLLEQNLPYVLEAINKYIKKTDGKGQLIIVDDASADDSVEFVNSFIANHNNPHIDIELFKNEKNGGFVYCVNKGVSKAKADIVVLLNSDVVVEKDFLEPLLAYFKNEKVFAVGCLDKSIENGRTVLRGRGIGKWERGLFIHARGEVGKKNTLWVSGGSGAFRQSVWEKLGGMDMIYSPFYWEDIDLSYRALKSGYEIVFEEKSIVEHRHEEGAIQKHFDQNRIKTISYRNQLIFIWKNITDLDWQFQHILWLPFNTIFALLRGDFVFLNALFRAFILLPKIIKSSHKAQRYFTRKDITILGKFKE